MQPSEYGAMGSYLGDGGHRAQTAMGLCGFRLPDIHISDLVAIGLLQRQLCPKLRQGRDLVNHMAWILGGLSEGISL